MDAADAIARITGSAVAGLQEIGSQHRWRHYRGRLAGGQEFFAKISERPLDALWHSEASGLRLMADAGAVPVPEVLGRDQNALVLSWVPPCSPDPAAAVRFGRELARLHAAGADGFGAPWPGFIASLPLDNQPARSADAWPRWYSDHRL